MGDSNYKNVLPAQVGGIVRAVLAGVGAVAMAAGVSVDMETANAAANDAITGLGAFMFLATTVWSVVKKLKS